MHFGHPIFPILVGGVWDETCVSKALFDFVVISTDEKEAAAALAESEQLVVQSTNHHVQPSPSSSSDRPVSNGVGNVWRRGGTEGGREGGGKRKGEKDGGKANGQGPETSQQVMHIYN